MKKLYSGLAAAALMSAGLVASTGTVVVAADPAGYPGTIATGCTVDSPGTVGRGDSAKFKALVTYAGGTPTTGSVKFVVQSKRANGPKVSSVEDINDNGKAKFKTSLNAKGKYSVKVKYLPTDGSVFKSCSASTSVKVVND
jgi:hypothetical protein